MAFVVVAQYRVRPGDEAQVANALRGQVLPSLADRTRLDLVPLED